METQIKANNMYNAGRILIADNDKSVLLTTADLLQSEGYQCTCVLDGHEAFQALKVNEFDLLIAEIHMPGNEDLELVQAAAHFAEGMPVILFASDPCLPSAISSVHLPVTAYLIKPVQPSVLLHHVKASIANYQAYKQREVFAERTIVFTWAIEETIRVLESTRSSFKSKTLAALRRKLERLIASERPDD
jgi:DNA-binding NtrC family response regulator